MAKREMNQKPGEDQQGQGTKDDAKQQSQQDSNRGGNMGGTTGGNKSGSEGSTSRDDTAGSGKRR